MADASANTRKIQAQTLYSFSKQRQYNLNQSTMGLKGAILMNGGGGTSSEVIAEKNAGAGLTPYINPISPFETLKAINIGINTFTIQWTGADNADFFSYSMPASIDNGRISQTATFSGLSPNTRYSVFVMADESETSILEGGARRSSVLEVLTGPNPPINFFLISKGQTFISCSWTSPDMSSIFTYSYTITGNDDSQQSGITSSTTLTINNLNPGITYNISIFTINITGTTSAPAFLPSGNITTLPGILYSYITALSPSSFTVAWNGLAKTNSYYIEYPRIQPKTFTNFIPSSSYAIGDKVTFNNIRYTCTTAYIPIIIGTFVTPYANPALDSINYNRDNFGSPMKSLYQFPKSYLDAANQFSFNTNVDSTGNNAIIFVTPTSPLQVGNYIIGPYINGYSQITGIDVNIPYIQGGSLTFISNGNNIVISTILNFNSGFDTTGVQYSYTIFASNSPAPTFSLTYFTPTDVINEITYSTINIGVDTSYLISQISSCTLYDFKVYACNSAWDSTPSSMISSLLTPPSGPLISPQISTQTFTGFVGHWPLEGIITSTYPSSICVLYDANSNMLQSNLSLQSNFSNYFSTTVSFSGLNINSVNLSITTFNTSGITSSSYIIPLLTTYSSIGVTTFNSNASPYIQISSIVTAGFIYSNTFELYSHGSFCNGSGFIQGTSYKSATPIQIINTLSTLTPTSPPNILSNVLLEYSTINITSNTIYKVESKLYYAPSTYFELDYYLLTIESGSNLFSNIVLTSNTSNSFRLSWDYKFSTITSFYSINSNTNIFGQMYTYNATGSNLGNTVQTFTINPSILEYQTSIGIYIPSILPNSQGFTSHILMAPSPAYAINYSGLSENSVTLSWSNNSIGLFAPLSTFVSYTGLTCNLPNNATTYTISGLTLNTLYTFSIVSCNTQGTAPPGSVGSPCGGGSSVGTITLGTAPVNVLASIVPSNVTSTFFTFNFPFIANTFFSYTLSNIDQPNFLTASNIQGPVSCNITSLSPNTTYWYYITQYTAFWSNTISNTVTTAPPPVIATYITTISTIQISWPTVPSFTYHISTIAGFSTLYVPNATSPYLLTNLSTANALTLTVGQSNAGGIQYNVPSTIWTNPVGTSTITWLAVSISSITVTWPQETTNNGVSYRCILRSNFGPLIESVNVTNTSRIYSNTISLRPIGFLAQCNFFNYFQLYISTVTPTTSVTSPPFTLATQPSYASLTTYISTIPGSGFSIGGSNIYSCGTTMICGMNYYSYGYATGFSNVNYQSNPVTSLGYISDSNFIGNPFGTELFATNASYATPSNLLQNSIYRIDHQLQNYLTTINLPALSTVVERVYLLTPQLNPFRNFSLSNVTISSVNIFHSWLGPTCNVNFSDSRADLISYGGSFTPIITTVVSSSNNTSNYTLNLQHTINITGSYRGNARLLVVLRENLYTYQSNVGVDNTLFSMANCNLHVLTAPDPSSNISYSSVLSNGFTLSFSNITAVFGIKNLSYYASNVGGNIYGPVSSIGVINASIPVTGLTANTLYTMKILACNVQTTSLPGTSIDPAGGGITESSNISILTAPASASNISVSSNTATSITLSWLNSSLGGAYPLSTLIVYNSLTCNAPPNSTSYTVGSLVGNTSYTFSIISCNIQATLGGGCNQSSNFTATTRATPLTGITYIPSLTSITANWSTIAGVSYIISTTTSENISVYATNISPPYTITSLPQGNSISLSIGIVNSGGISYSIPSTLWTTVSPVPQLTYNAVNLSSFTITWPPASANNAITYRVNLYNNNGVLIENSPSIANTSIVYTPVTNLYPASGYNTYSNIYNVYISTITPANVVTTSAFQVYTQLEILTISPYSIFTPPFVQLNASNVAIAGLVRRVNVWMNDYGYSTSIINSNYQQLPVNDNANPVYTLFYTSNVLFSNVLLSPSFSQNFNKVVRLRFQFFNLNVDTQINVFGSPSLLGTDASVYRNIFLLTPQFNPFQNVVLSNITTSNVSLRYSWYGATSNVSFSSTTVTSSDVNQTPSILNTISSFTNNTSNYQGNGSSEITVSGTSLGNTVLTVTLVENTLAYQTSIGVSTSFSSPASCNIFILTGPPPRINIDFASTAMLSNSIVLRYEAATRGELFSRTDYILGVIGFSDSVSGGNVYNSNVWPQSASTPVALSPINVGASGLIANRVYTFGVVSCNTQLTPIPGTLANPCGGGMSSSSNLYILTAPEASSNLSFTATSTSITLTCANASFGRWPQLSNYVFYRDNTTFITTEVFTGFSVTSLFIDGLTPATSYTMWTIAANIRTTAAPGSFGNPCGGGSARSSDITVTTLP